MLIIQLTGLAISISRFINHGLDDIKHTKLALSIHKAHEKACICVIM